MGKHLFGISTLIMSIALLIWSIGETFAYPQGPNVSLGSNPIVTLDCGSTTTSTDIGGYPTYSNPYVVPAGFDYIITDLGAHYSGATSINVDNGNGWKNLHVQYFVPNGGNAQSGGFSLQTGAKVPSGASVRCSGNDGFVSGYLAHQ
jgi:hypothetical protein